MSWVLLLTADKPLPLCDHQQERSVTVRVGGKEYTISSLSGFKIEDHIYYRSSVDLLNYPMKPY